ncbi:MAG: hypothetical protein A2Z83_03695 [Omnitrophica bacterium GWA2_52_8]|nr:MAG: hypothetical protein A2Z83_03695 [Omnitrophica bacterium GWA2_52_8]
MFPNLGNEYFGNSLYAYGKSGIIFLSAVFVLYLLNLFVIKRLRAFTQKTKTLIDDFVLTLFANRVLPLIYLGAFYFAVYQLKLAPSIAKTINIAALVVLVLQVTRMMTAIVSVLLHYYWKQGKVMQQDSMAAKTVTTIAKAVIWGLAAVFVMDNLGFNISAVVAGLGIGGIAVALAAQNILGDLFNYFVIFFDTPFEYGDFIIIDDHMGVVENVGIKTTRIRSLGGEQIVIANSDLTSSRIRNFKRMQQRRVLFKLGVVYGTSYEKMKKIPLILREVIESIKDTRFDRAHFQGYGDFSLNIEVVYYLLSPDYNVHMDVQEKINLAILERFAAEQIEFAYPTQTLYVNKV